MNVLQRRSNMDGLLNAAKIYLWVQAGMGVFIFLMFCFIVVVSIWKDK